MYILGLLFWGPLWLLGSVVVGQRATDKGRSFALGFVLSLIASPLLGALFVQWMTTDDKRMALKMAQKRAVQKTHEQR